MPISKAELESKHLAELHQLAAEAGVPRLRLLRRDELIEELLVRSSADSEDEPGEREERESEPRPRRRRRSRRPRGDSEDSAGGPATQVTAEEERPDDTEAEAEPRMDEETAEVGGVLDVLPQGHGFVRLAGLDPGPDDVYISASQIRRCELRPGDQLTGPARQPRRGERHPALVRVDSVNGDEPTGERSAKVTNVFQDMSEDPTIVEPGEGTMRQVVEADETGSTLRALYTAEVKTLDGTLEFAGGPYEAMGTRVDVEEMVPFDTPVAATPAA